MPPRARLAFACLIAAAACLVPAHAARPLFTIAFPPAEFAAHRARVFERIGDGVAVLQGAAELGSYLRFRQSNHFFYLTGVESPRALVLLDGRTKATTLFLAAADERMVRSEGAMLTPGDEAVRLTGIADVQPREAFAAAVRAAAAGRIVYTPMRAESLAAVTPDAASRHAAASKADPWDQRPSREEVFVERLRAAAPVGEVRDLDPILDALRVTKTPREVAAIRESTRVAGLAMLAAMRSVGPGQRENDVEAIGDAVFKHNGAQGIAYFGLVAAGANAIHPHYHAGTDLLRAGDLVLFDYAPDINYYASDVTRMFPVSGRFSPAQRELYGLYQRLYTTLMRAIRVHVAPHVIEEAATADMARIVAGTTFSKPAYRAAAERFVGELRASTRNSLGHFVGMEVHDVATDIDTLEPGMVFSIEPALVVPEEQIYIRLEDVIVITPTGYENLSAFVPSDIAGVEEERRKEGEMKNGK